MEGIDRLIDVLQIVFGKYLVNALSFCVALGAGSGMWTGVQSLFSSRVQKAVRNIISIDEREINRLGRSGRVDSSSLDSVDLFEFHDVVMIALNVMAVISLPLWCLFLWVGVCFSFGVSGLLVPFSFFSGTSPTFALAFCAFYVLWLGCYTRLIYKLGVVGKFRHFREACRTRPSYPHVPALLLVSSMMYAIFLCVTPLPSLWRWSLITAHTARAVRVWYSLLGQIGVAKARGEVSADML